MIQANELRKNILVTVDNEKYHPKLKNIPLQVVGFNPTVLKGEITYAVSLEHIHQEKNKYYESYSQFIKFIKPIPLAGEWLKYVPKIVRIGEWEYDVEFRFREKELVIWGTDGCTDGHNIRIPCLYVHNLQNI